MTIEEALQAYCRTLTGLTALVGTNGIYWQVAPQGAAYPHVVFWMVSQPIQHAHDGRDGIPECRIQWDVYATNPADLTAIRKQLRSLDGFAGVLSGIRVQSILFEDDGQGKHDEPPSGDENRLFINSVDSLVCYEEP